MDSHWEFKEFISGIYNELYKESTEKFEDSYRRMEVFNIVNTTVRDRTERNVANLVRDQVKMK